MGDKVRCECEWCKKAYAPLPDECECGSELVRYESIFKQFGECPQCARLYERFREQDIDNG